MRLHFSAKASTLPLLILTFSLLLLTALMNNSQACEAKSHIKNESGMNDPLRPDNDKKRDANRKPLQVLDFFDVKPGMQVLDLIASGGYYTEVLSHRVGQQGTVYAHNPAFILEARGGRFKTEMNLRLSNNRLSNVIEWHKPIENLELTEQVDIATLILNYHDIYSLPQAQKDAFLLSVYTALKAGGTFAIIDNQGISGSEDVKRHRLNKRITIENIKQAGFILEQESTLLSNPNDNHQLTVFDPKIRGKVDRYILKFVKV